MRIELEEGTKLDFFQNLYKEARSYADELICQMEKNLKQYKGSKEIDGSDEEAKVVRNITYELVESQITGYIPTAKVDPKVWSDKGDRCAKSIEVMLSNKRNEINFEAMNDIDERYNPIYGGSVWLVEWDESIKSHNVFGDVAVQCLSPMHFTGQPHLYNVQDMEYCFVEFSTTKEDIVRRYNVSYTVAEEAENEDYSDEKTATLYVCYYKDDEGRICQYVWSGDTELSDITDFYSRKRKVCKKCGRVEALCNCEKPKFELQNEEYEELTRDIQTSDGVIPAFCEMIRDGQIVTELVTTIATDDMGQPIVDNVNGSYVPVLTQIEVPKTEPTKIPYYKPTLLPIVIRKNTSQEDSLFGQSDVEFIRSQQQAINKVESRIAEKVLKSGVFPVIPEDSNISLKNDIFGTVLKARQDNYALFGRVDLSVNISYDVAEADRLYDHAKRILGISDSFQGQHDSSAQSGKAKQLQIQQAAGRLDSKRQMKNAAYSEIDRIIFEYYLAYADEPRPAVYKDAMGRRQNVVFNRYDFVERDEAGVWYYNDQFLFSCDATLDVDRQRDVLWQENRLNFQQGAYGDPAIPQTQLVFWLNMEKLHYPFAHDNVERLREEIQRQAEIAQLQAEIQNRDTIINQQKAEIQNRAEYENLLISKIAGGNANGGARV